MKQIPFFLITGFLGSGKTCLLKRFLERHADERRLAIVQNEFAAGNVDGRELKRTGKKFEMLEVNRGSVFCVCLLSGFAESLVELVDEVQPDAVVLEATGLADPIAITQLLAAPKLRERFYLAHSWCVVDAASFLQLDGALGQVSHQVRIADSAVINKVDLVDEGMLGQVRQRVAALNPLAEVVETTYGEVGLAEVFAPLTEEPVAARMAVGNGELESCGRPPVESAALRTVVRVSRAALDGFLARYREVAYRIKGFVNLEDGEVVSVQCAFGEMQVEPVSGYASPTELIALGPGISPRQFARDFRSAAA